MSKLFLLRTNEFRYLGPYDIQDLKNQNPKIITDCEVSGNTGPWVHTKDSTLLEQTYPEIVAILPVHTK